MTALTDITALATQVKTFIETQQTKIDKINTGVNQGSDQYTGLLSLCNDPRQANALEKFNLLVAKRTAIADQWNSYTQYSLLIQNYNNLSEADKDNTQLKNLMFGYPGTDGKRVPGVIDLAGTFVSSSRTQKDVYFPNVKTRIELGQAGPLPATAPACAMVVTQGGKSAPLVQPGLNLAGGLDQALFVEDGGQMGGELGGGDGAGTSTTPDPNKPGRRLKNPLGWFSSSTYQLTLYMISPAGYNSFIESGRRTMPGLATNQTYILAQSGGVKSENRAKVVSGPNAGEKIAPFDYYIDNLKLISATNAKETNSATNVTEISFTIMEPYGFSFLTVLKNASASLQLGNPDPGYGNANIQNPIKQFFILGIRFLGYDSEGNLMNGSRTFENNVLDPNYIEGSSQGLFERYFDIIITEVKFKIDGKVTTYNIKATALSPQTAFTVKRGFLTGAISIEAGTVGEALLSLVAKLNSDQEELVNDKKVKRKNIYQIKGLTPNTGDYPPGFESITKASIISKEDRDQLSKLRWAVSPSNNTVDANAALYEKTYPDNTKNIITFATQTPILQNMTQIINQSTFVRDALRVIYESKIQPNQQRPEDNQDKPDTKKRFQWFNCSAEVTNPKWDEETNDFAWTITYIIQAYEVPVLNSTYANPGVSYYGPHKRYEYWYTGENREVLNYEQTLDNAYFNAVLAPSTPDDGRGGGGDVQSGKVPNQQVKGDRSGKVDKGQQSALNATTDLTDPGSYATAKITILGDPDFLVCESESSSNLNELYRRFYGTDQFTINPNGGQVFIEVDFKEPVDYNEKGYLDINSNIVFWKYPENISKVVKGVSYMVIQVTSNFSNGRFTQTLDCTINTFPDSDTPAST